MIFCFVLFCSALFIQMSCYFAVIVALALVCLSSFLSIFIRTKMVKTDIWSMHFKKTWQPGTIVKYISTFILHHSSVEFDWRKKVQLNVKWKGTMGRVRIYRIYNLFRDPVREKKTPMRQWILAMYLRHQCPHLCRFVLCCSILISAFTVRYYTPGLQFF